MLFNVRVAKAGTGTARLKVEADSAAAALSAARSQGYVPLEVVSTSANALIRQRGRFSLLLFSQELLALLSAGLSLIEGLETLSEKAYASTGSGVLQRLLHNLYQGKPLSDAMERQPDVFPALFVATVRASEKTGNLAEALERYIVYETQFDTVRKKVVAASVYPLLLLGVGALVTFFLLAYVVPRFGQVFADSAVELPVASRLLLQWGTLVTDHGAELLAVALAAGLAAAWAVAQEPVRRAAARQLWRLPALGERARLYHLARFYRTLGMIQRGGIPLTAALEMAGGLLSPALLDNLARASGAVEQGLPLSRALADNDLTTPVALRMLRVGERSGRMAEMLERIGAFYDEDMARWVEITTRLFEPLLMVAIGLVIGGIVLLMYLPIFELAGSVQ